MSSQTENVQINLKLNGIEQFKSFRDLSQEIIAQRNRVSRMDKTDLGYGPAVQKLNQMLILQREWRNEIYKTSEAAKKQAKDVKSSWDEIKGIFGGVTLGSLAADGIKAGISAIGNFISGSQQAYAEAEQGQAQLEAVIKSTGGTANKTIEQLNELSGSLMNLTGVDDDVITKGESLLLTFTNVSGEIYDRAMPAIVDMTAALNKGSVTMETISGTSMMIGKALNDPIRGLTALRKVGVSFSEDQANTIKKMVELNQVAEAQGVILNELNKEFGGMGEALASTETGALQRFETRIGNIQENLGAWITSMKAVTVSGLGPFLDAVEKWVNIPTAEKLRDEQYELNTLVVAISHANNSQLVRNSLIAELQQKYPDFLGKLDKEQITTELLERRLKGVNAQYRDKIALAANQDKISDLEKKRGELTATLSSYRKTLTEAIIKTSDKTAADLISLSDSDFDKYAEKLKQKMKKTPVEIRELLGGSLYTDVSRTFKGQTNLYDIFTPGSGRELFLKRSKELEETNRELEQYTVAQAKSESDARLENIKRIDQEIAALKNKKGTEDEIARLKIERSKLDGTYKAPITKGSDPNGDAKAKAAEARRKQAIAQALAEDKKLNEEYKKLGIEQLNDVLSKNSKEVAIVAEKYQKLIDEQVAFLNMSGANDDQKKKREDQIEDLKVLKKQAVASATIRIHEEMNSAIDNLRLSLSNKHETELKKERDLINKFYDDQVKDNEGNSNAIAELNKNRVKELTDAELREKQRLKEEKDKMEVVVDASTAETHAGRLAAIKKQYDEEIRALKDKYTQEGIISQEGQDLINKINANRDKANANENKKYQQEVSDTAIQGAETIANAVATISNNNRKRESDLRMKNLEDQRAKELSNKNLTEDQKKAINDKFDAQVKQEKLRAWKADQNAAAKQAIIAGLLGAAKALPNFVAAGIALGAGIANAIAIKSEKPPVYRKGALVPTGPSHEQGGIDLVNNATGEHLGEMEGGEPLMVLSKDTYANNRQLVNELLYNSQYRNGAPVSVNTDLASKAMRYATGGVIEQIGQENNGKSPISIVQTDNSGMEDKLDELIEKWDEGIPFNYLNLVEHQNKVDKIRNRVNA
ncbi:hypothetical protein [Pedobacter sp.]|uniref:hypothetical protein n=1 Tax=Pedobacter sp. TaxID=1411316 RepID=UPI0031D07EEA